MQIVSATVSENFESTATFQICPIDHTHFATSSNDNILRLWSLPTLTLTHQQSFPNYIYAIAYNTLTQHLLIGDGLGNILALTREMQEISKTKVHDDLIVKIILQKEDVITSSIDYTVKVLDPETFGIKRVFSFSEPVWNIAVFKEELYVLLSQAPSVRIVHLEEQISLEWPLCNMVEVESEEGTSLVGCQPDLHTLHNLTTKEVSSAYCQGLASYKGKLVATDEEKVIVFVDGSQREYDSPLGRGCTVFDSREVGEWLVLAADNKKIIAMKFDI